MKLKKTETKQNNFQDKTNEEIIEDIDPVLLAKARERLANLSKDKRDHLETCISWLFLPENLKQATREKIQARMKIIDIFSIIVAFIGILCSLAASSLHIEFFSEYSINKETLEQQITIKVIQKSSDLIDILRWITSVTTFLLIILIVLHYLSRVKFYIFKQRLPINSTLFSDRKMMLNFIFEIMICLIHCPPYVDTISVSISTTGEQPKLVEVDLDLILTTLIPLRVYLLGRFYSFYSHWADDKAEKICNECNAMGGISFAIKAELKERPYTVVGILMLISILIFGYGLRNIEVSFIKEISMDKFQDWRFVWNGFWCIIITILTVGFGDYYPQTHLGRLICVVACLWGTFLISLMVVSLTISVEFTPQEEKAYEELKNSESNLQLRIKAIELVRLSHKLKVAHEAMIAYNTRESKLEYVIIYKRFKKSLDLFRIMRRNVISKEHEVSAETILHKLSYNVTEQMDQMIQITSFHVTSLMEHIKLSKDLQSQISESSDRLETLVRGLYKCISFED